MKMIETKKLAFKYHGSHVILRNVSFSLEAGHCLALLGNNGAGKSTLLKCLIRILEPKADMLMVSGQNIFKMKRNQIAKCMTYVDQHNEVNELTVFDAVLLGRRPYIKMEPSEEDIAIVHEVMRRMELEDYALRYMSELSGGELQKVVLARALAQQPKVLLLDEPTANLDLYNQHEVMRTVCEIAKDDHILVIVAIHDLNLAVRYCDRFLFIRDGRVYRFGDASIITEEVISAVYGIPVKIRMIDGQTLVIVQ